MDQKTWIVVGNASCVRFFRCDTVHSLVEIETLVHAESRLHAGDLISDKPGGTTDVNRNGYTAFVQSSDPKAVEMEGFAKDVVAFLEQARNRGDVERIHVAASPSFLGVLRQSMGAPLTKIIDKTVSKDITHLKGEDLPPYFFS